MGEKWNERDKDKMRMPAVDWLRRSKLQALQAQTPPSTSAHSHLRNGETGDLRRCEWDRRSADCRLCNVVEVLCGV